jgi:hypothetical protein
MVLHLNVHLRTFVFKMKDGQDVWEKNQKEKAKYLTYSQKISKQVVKN